ncbi:MAG: hypothetical protein E7017_02920 [Alphaproteobacteria bacterium]|nr:hypothetical protein [Alphaproteobacteria bacterium]
MDNKDKIFNDLKVIITEVYGGTNLSNEAITMDSNISNDLGLGSMDMVELIMKLEEKYDFRLTAKEEEELILKQNTITIKNVVDKVAEIVEKLPVQSVSDNASGNVSLESIAHEIRQKLQKFAELPDKKISFTIEKTDNGYKLTCN